MIHKPIKRHPSIQPVSRDHHQGLLLCWKIREGLKKGVSVERIKAYVDWFWLHHLVPHFELEEKALFPILGGEHVHVVKVLADHTRLKTLFAAVDCKEEHLRMIQKELNDHIRFEERVLFNEIQAVASQEQLARIEVAHAQYHVEEVWTDEFWSVQ
ncbi:cation-binding protein [Reichenbachiella sp. 5M10]|uniref:hemerythrin domain-containing protein n=1 Tax=Reichenbachiella sp. 5M10 TaxID=1889772 RepID=UPI000C15DBFD|nr:hemerythrin domain-containing protein [Reichenbachiella sp. 5M10]PIB37414.1 cation-binding protein [Reichenbachiella sp. 5M10]